MKILKELCLLKKEIIQEIEKDIHACLLLDGDKVVGLKSTKYIKLGFPEVGKLLKKNSLE